ncbi:hypothetical protein [Tenacibaculum amylolyticum]|uniref:hypothetical protein n=1 Tax=Tenacibaculum amylolyticum TaxID=104269 RepID=UPI003894357D
MTSGLRKTHRYVWLVLILVMPILMYFAIQNDPYTVLENTKTVKEPSSFISKNEHLSYQKKGVALLILIKKPFKNASVAVYELQNGEQGDILGEIASAQETYAFNINANADGFLLYDVIKKEAITKIKF